VIISYANATQLGTGGNSVYSTSTGVSPGTNWVHKFTASGSYTA
jgi:hypothetical protein